VTVSRERERHSHLWSTLRRAKIAPTPNVKVWRTAEKSLSTKGGFGKGANKASAVAESPHSMVRLRTEKKTIRKRLFIAFPRPLWRVEEAMECSRQNPSCSRSSPHTQHRQTAEQLAALADLMHRCMIPHGRGISTQMMSRLPLSKRRFLRGIVGAEESTRKIA